MNTTLIDGVGLSRTLRAELSKRVAARIARGATRPGLAVLLVGDNAASRVYIRNKTRACDEVGITSVLIELPAASTEADLLRHIAAVNARADIHGILVQLPLPPHIAAQKVLEAIAPQKDIDGFHLHNVGALVAGNPLFVPCTPAGILAMLDAEGIDPRGRHAVIVGASNIVGKPVAMLLLQKGATVTICNSKTPDLGAMTRQADILVVAVGKPNLVTGTMVKPGAVVIDVGINRLADGKLAGDCDLASMQGIAAKVTPVPGGVGPMTVTMLVANTVAAAERMSNRQV